MRSNYLSTCNVLNGSATGYLRLNSNFGGEDGFVYYQNNVENIKKLIRNQSTTLMVTAFITKRLNSKGSPDEDESRARNTVKLFEFSRKLRDMQVL